MFYQSYGFSDVAIKQKMNVCSSRQDVKIESEIIRGIIRPIPIIASNMSTVTNPEFCIKLYKCGAMGVLHRAFEDNSEYIREVTRIAKEIPIVSVSVGVKDSDYLLLDQLVRAGANCIVVDIANGFCENVLQICKHIRTLYPLVRIVAGNTVNPNAIEFFGDNIDALKCGIASGFVCETKNTSGCYKPQFSAVYDMKEKAHKYGMPIISDGGIREPADFSKSIGAGASSVMAGSIFARCPESAGEIVEIDGLKKKIYSGMSSRKVQEKWRGKVHNNCPEGKTVFLDVGESVENLLARYAGALRSGISYAGFNNIEDFKNECEFILI